MKLFIILIIIFFSFSSFASLQQAFEQYKLGNYEDAIKFAKNYSAKSKSEQNAIFYIQAQSYKANQEYKKSIKFYLLVLQSDPSKKNIYFDIAQSHYALNELDKALNYFKLSSKNNYKRNQSFYYIAYIYSLFDQYKNSIFYYRKILKDKIIDKNLKQASLFQYNESRYYHLKKKKIKIIKKLVKINILPSLRKALLIDTKSKIARDIKKRIASLEKEFGFDPNTMWNGKKIPSKRYNITASQIMGYDTNVSNQNDSTIATTVTKIDSLHSITNLDLNYLSSLKKRYLLTSGIAFYNLYYNEQENKKVFKNNSTSWNSYFNSSLEHKLFQKPASLLFELTYEYLTRDLEGTKKNIFQARSQTATLGEKFNFFAKGATSIKYKFKNYVGYLDTISTSTHSLIMDQLIQLKNKKLLIIFAEADLINYYRDSNSSVNSYLIRLDYIINIEKLSFDFAFLANFTDTLAQFDTRGMESLIIPSIKITRNISKNLSVALYHEYSRNNSKDNNFDYKKNITNIEFNLSF